MKGLVRYSCSNNKCSHSWVIFPGYLANNPPNRKEGECYCGTKLPKTEDLLKKEVFE